MSRPPLPAAFLARERLRQGDAAADDLAAALERTPDLGLRANPRVGGVREIAERRGWAAQAVPWCLEGATLARTARGTHPATRHPWHDAGAYYLQDPSAMGVVPLLDPRPGELVLDLAAAPGGKATHVAARLGVDGLLWAHDAVPARAEALVRNLERWGAPHAVVSRGDPRHLRRLGPAFDRVLVDAPCSGEGMFRKSDAARERWSLHRVRACAAVQGHLVDLACDLLKPGGVLVYATCTFAPEEDEGVVEALLRRRPDMDLEDLAAGGIRPLASDAGDGPVAQGTVRWWPHRGPGEGHFAARLRRRGEPTASSARAPRPTATLRPADAGQVAAWRAFATETLGAPPLPGQRLATDGERLWSVPSLAWSLPLAGARAGVPLGRVATDRLGRRRFEPHHALTRVLPDLGRSCATLDLDEDDPRVAAYLRGEPLPAPGMEGWAVVRVDGVPLGWLKGHGGHGNNHYPRGLRRGPGPPPELDANGS